MLYKSVSTSGKNIDGITKTKLKLFLANKDTYLKEECYKHMYVSPSKCCQKLRSNMEKSGFAEDIKNFGFQQVMLNHALSQTM